MSACARPHRRNKVPRLHGLPTKSHLLARVASIVERVAFFGIFNSLESFNANRDMARIKFNALGACVPKAINNVEGIWPTGTWNDVLYLNVNRCRQQLRYGFN